MSPRPDGSDTTQEQTSTLWECADDGYELLPGFGGDRRGSLQSRLEALGLGPVADAIGAEGASERRFRGVTSIGDHRLELRLGPLCGASDAVIAYWVRASMQRNAQVSDAKLTGRFHATLLHNALNVLNSANVAASTVETVLARSKVSSLGRLASLVAGPVGVPNEFLWTNPAGREIPRALWLIAEELEKEREQLQAEALHLRRSIGHVKRILQSQPASGGRDAGRSYEELLELAHGLSGLSTQRDIQVERRCNASCSCHVDEDRFLQVLVNLLSNARHSILRAGIQGRIELSVAQRSNGWVSVGVSDNGIGIDDTALSALFSWGFTTRGDGHGVGLAASAHAAREFCGTLTGASKGAGMGAIFTLELPPAAQGDS